MDVYRHIVSFLPVCDIPVVSRGFLIGYVQKKWKRLKSVPVLVDIWWHAPGFCRRYCVCRVASEYDRLLFYSKRVDY